ncbi:MAG: lipoprotein-releasing ABC transporter permease subunit [candidate division Zixibacteria bacterium]|nr:lipoprotein-releasing ABC transporter permease subunit [candidate division Zixibacteria bacterium]
MRYEWFIARRYLMSRRRGFFISLNNFFSIGGVVVGVAALIFVMSMMNGFETELRSRILGVTSHITVYPRFDPVIADPPATMAELKTVDGVVAAAPFIYYKAAVASEETGDGIIVRGIDLAYEDNVSGLKATILSGRYDLSPNDQGEGGIIIGKSLASRLNVLPGDPLVLFSLQGEKLRANAQPRVKRFEVRAIFETGMYEYDASMAYISIPDAADLFKTGGVTGIHLKTRDIFSADQTAEEIGSRFGERYDAIDWKKMNKNLFSWMQLEKIGMFIALSLIIAVAAFNIISTLVMIVMEKRQEIGILKTMGSVPASISRIFMGIGLVVGGIGCLLGWLVGFLLCYLQLRFNIVSLPAEIYFINSLPIDMQPLDFIIVGLASIALCFLATLYPARRAARLSVVEVLRH